MSLSRTDLAEMLDFFERVEFTVPRRQKPFAYTFTLKTNQVTAFVGLQMNTKFAHVGLVSEVGGHSGFGHSLVKTGFASSQTTSTVALRAEATSCSSSSPSSSLILLCCSNTGPPHLFCAGIGCLQRWERLWFEVAGGRDSPSTGGSFRLVSGFGVYSGLVLSDR